MSITAKPPFKYFTEADGSALESGKIYIGVAGLDAEANPITAYWDSAATITAAQPIRTIGGAPDNSGTPSDFFTKTDYSITVRDKNDVLVYSKLQLNSNDPAVSGYLRVKTFGATGDGITDDAASIQEAVDAAVASDTVLVYDAGDYLIGSAINVSGNLTMYLGTATLKGSGLDTNYSLFAVVAANNALTVKDGTIKSAKAAVEITDIDDFTFIGTKFTDLAYGIAAHTISGGRTARVENCDFSDLEVGCGIQTSDFEDVLITGNTFKNLHEQTLTLRPYPLDKKIVSGFWLQALSGTLAINISNNFVDGVVGFAVPHAEPEVHGLAASCITGAIGNIIIDGNIVKNVDGTSSPEGDEGILGRGHAVIITNNILLDAGMREGCIYAKGSEYHRIAHNTIEISLTNPDIAVSRGIISASDYAEIHGNKFINTAFGIYSRSLVEKIDNNEFINNEDACYTLALEDLSAHTKTELSDNYADTACGNFFVVGTTGTYTVTYGDFHILDNKIYCKGGSVILREGENFLFQDNYVNRVSPNTRRECIEYKKQMELSVIKGNNVVGFDDSNGTGRFLTGWEDWSPRLIAKDNYFGAGSTAFYLAGATTYIDIIIADNDFLSNTTSPMAIGGISVVGVYKIANNTGHNSKEVDGTAAPTAGTWAAGDRIYDSTPSAGGTMGWVCITDGTFSAASDITGDTDGSTAVITGLTDTSDFFVGNYVTVSAGMPSAATPYRITELTSTTMTLDTASTSAQTDVTIVTVDPTFKTFGAITA